MENPNKSVLYAMVTALAETLHTYKKFLTELVTHLDQSLCGRMDFSTTCVLSLLYLCDYFRR